MVMVTFRAIVLAMVVVAVGGAVNAETILYVESACDGLGLAGWIDQDGTRALFETCGTPDAGQAQVWAPTGESLFKVSIEQGRVTGQIAEIEVTESNTPEELDLMAKVFEMPEAKLVGEQLWQKMNQAGFTPSAYPKPMAALAADLSAYDYDLEPEFPGTAADDCMGCCGWRCSGCTGCYTQACYEHDKCVAQKGHAKCVHLWLAAAASAWECVG